MAREEEYLSHDFLNPRRPRASCYFHTEQVITGLDLPLLHCRNSVNVHPYVYVHEGKQFPRHPDHVHGGVRLPCIKHWNSEPLIRVARNAMRCPSCNVVVQGGRKGDRPINTYTLYNSDFDLVEELSGKGGMAGFT